MPARSLIIAAAMASAAIATPLSLPPATLVKKQSGRCPPTFSTPEFPDQPFVADLGFFSDDACNDGLSYVCVYAPQGVIDAGSGAYGCNPGLLPDDTPFYMQVQNSPFNQLQLLFTQDQSCPPDGPGAVYATIGNNQACVRSNLGGDVPGVTVFPNGGSGIARYEEDGVSTFVSANATKRDIEAAMLLKMKRQSNTRCDGFVVDSQSDSRTRTVQVSNIIDCTNGGEQGCTISVEEQESQSISTSYSLTAGGGIEGIFSVEATFGMEFTQEQSTAIQNGFAVDAGQRGYIGAYSRATLFEGRFTGCDQGDAEQPGSTLAIKQGQIVYSIVITGANKH